MALRLTLLNEFELEGDGRPIGLPAGAQRLVAFLALQDRPRSRVHIAGTLWPETSDGRAGGNLRSALCRLRTLGLRLVEARQTHLALAADISVDVHDLAVVARAVLDVDDPARAVRAGVLELLDGELLPDWYDDWVLIERERLRQLRLHALELLADRLTRAGRFAEALGSALAALRGDLLRESAHRQLIRTYLAEGNHVEAMRQYGLYRRLLADRLGLEPSPQMHELVRPLGAARGLATVTRP